jgi:hypothetical protein
MMKLGLVFLLVSATAAFAQADCPVCEPAAKLKDELRKIEIGNAAQKAQGEALGREGLKLLAAFADNPPPAKQGRRSFEALLALSLYAAPLLPAGDYEKALAAIAARDPEYRKRYQALVRKGMRARDRRESCQMRYLQTNVSVQECRMQEAAKGANDDLAHKRCDASYALDQCLAKKK